jgi:ferredoxin
MAIVVTDNCQRCRFTECVTVCPVACFHGDDQMLYVDNDACIDCKACIQVCPVSAISDSNDLGADMIRWVAINAERAAELPVISEKQTPYPGAEERAASLGFAPLTQ